MARNITNQQRRFASKVVEGVKKAEPKQVGLREAEHNNETTPPALGEMGYQMSRK